MIDRMMRAAAVTALLALCGAAKANDQWTYSQTVDEFTDEASSSATAPAIIGKPFNAALTGVKCSISKKVFAVAMMDYYNNAGSKHAVKVRFDDDEPKRVGIVQLSGTRGFEFKDARGFVSGLYDEEVLTLPQFILELINKNRLRIQTNYYNHGSVVLDFSLAGAADAIRKVIDDCDAWDWLGGKPPAATDEVQQGATQ